MIIRDAVAWFAFAVLACMPVTLGCGADAVGHEPDVDAQERLFAQMYSHALPGPYRTCTQDADCGSDLSRCYRFGGHVGVCDEPGMGGGCSRCPSDMRCRTIDVTCSCEPGQTMDICVDAPCQADSDCPSGEACVPAGLVVGKRCVPDRCGRDERCTAGRDGRCGLLLWSPSQQGEVSPYAVACVYRALPGEEYDLPSCPGSGTAQMQIRADDDPGGPNDVYYTCE